MCLIKDHDAPAVAAEELAVGHLRSAVALEIGVRRHQDVKTLLYELMCELRAVRLYGFGLGVVKKVLADARGYKGC